ncbi:hypothetical protein NDU88_004167 [Pleurodeles waltl]|uniref:Uncharacterized protein n=1 Tax=Pleurodeles waltl TaxID=8319 RepID=A0AAV7MUE5_PLEWA|nr:hypothetical protein NDU88_004167 [Pleurodeles waltl]
MRLNQNLGDPANKETHGDPNGLHFGEDFIKTLGKYEFLEELTGGDWLTAVVNKVPNTTIRAGVTEEISVQAPVSSRKEDAPLAVETAGADSRKL